MVLPSIALLKRFGSRLFTTALLPLPLYLNSGLTREPFPHSFHRVIDTMAMQKIKKMGGVSPL